MRLSSLDPGVVRGVSVYAEFLESASKHDLDVISGIQYYYNCTNAAGTRCDKGLLASQVTSDSEEQNSAKKNLSLDEEEDVDMDIASQVKIQLTEADLHAYEESQINPQEEHYGKLAVSIACAVNMMDQEDNKGWDCQSDKSNASLAQGGS
ncbi:hypothetical protein OG21DRAFT_1525482 [Imleria badia]|nr:hypothetical protein OG21DRAFT_1525482 [Imleria badia]